MQKKLKYQKSIRNPFFAKPKISLIFLSFRCFLAQNILKFKYLSGLDSFLIKRGYLSEKPILNCQKSRKMTTNFFLYYY